MPQEPLPKTFLSIRSMTLCSLFTALIAVGAFIQIQFPVVPITLQTLFVLLCALLLGAKRSAVSVGLYLLLGLAGLPVFTKGGGPGYVLQPTFGYLLGFLAAAFVVGALAQKAGTLFHRQSTKTPYIISGPLHGDSARKILYYWGIGLAGILVIYLSGMVYMYFIMKYYMKTPIGFLGFFSVNFFLTFAGDVFKCFVAAWLTVRLMPVLRKTMRFSE